VVFVDKGQTAVQFPQLKHASTFTAPNFLLARQTDGMRS